MERTIKPEDLAAIVSTVMVLDVRRKEDREPSSEAIEGAIWKDPTQIEQWVGAVPREHPVILYCVRGGSVSNSVLDRLLAGGVQARYIAGGIEGWKAAGGKVVPK
jgi:rhodanese-related sulfurtransferase